MKKPLAICSLVLGLTQATTLIAQEWACSFPGQRVDGYLRGQVFVTLNGDQSSVFDSLINEMHGGPIPARVTADNEDRFTVKWRLRNVDLRRGFAPKIDYTLTYRKTRGSASFTGIAPILHDNNNADRAGGNFGASGTCKAR